jgi:hypothetical protein
LIVESYTTSDFLNLTIFNHMPKSFTGGCACGAIRYEVNAEPIAMFNCHCRDCQQMTGGAYTPVVYVPAKAFKLTKGAPCFYNTSSEAMGDNKRAFCPECGSRLFGAITEQARGITASSLDDPTLFKPQFEIWTSEAQPWDHMDPKLQKFEKYAPN